MTDVSQLEEYGVLVEPATLKIQRLLPGPIERVWAYLTQSDLRRQWLASGDMELSPGATFELVWRNDELTDPPGERPPGFSSEHSMKNLIVEVDPPYKLVTTFGNAGEVTYELTQQGSEVLLTLIHRRLPDLDTIGKVGPGWHMHLDILVARLTGRKTEPFWDGWTRLRKEYERRLSA